MREYVSYLEANSLFGNLRITYRNPRGLTSKFTKGVGCPKQVGNLLKFLLLLGYFQFTR
jgi:hypothetical protein